ncbi:MAG TPA: tetraacyldisaccharide 4'-kinase [Candidatus Binataceae bacterium]|nr:tetraacyldisaccharide 4'-kinase [Candidatus Binataceae bacterium]
MAGRETIRPRSRIEDLWFGKLRWEQRAMVAGLVPASWFYRAGQSMRNVFWHFAKKNVPARTISVGNLTVGGNGKTPFTLFLASRLQAHGLSVGIVSRGFGRSAAKRQRAALVSDATGLKLSPEQAGDEPVMMAKSFRGPIVVSARRIDGIRLLSEIAHPDVIVLDDAFQHRALERDVDLVLINRERGFGNAHLLPAGPLRERPRAIGRADAAVIVSSGIPDRASAITSRQMRAISRIEVLNATLRPKALVRYERGNWLEVPVAMAGRRVLAVSGLADPSGFYAMLHEVDTDLVGVLEYPDHHVYNATDWQTIVKAAMDADIVLTTEKDLVKLEKFPFARDSLYALRLEVVMSPADMARLDEIALGSAPQADVAAAR